MSELTDPSKAMQFYSSGSANSASFGPENVFNATWCLMRLMLMPTAVFFCQD